MITFLVYYDRKLCEAKMQDQYYDILASNKLEGIEHDLKVSIVKFRNDFFPRIVITSLNDPNLSGYVEYKDKHKAIMAYNELNNMRSVIRYMELYKNEPSAYRFELILKDERIELPDDKDEEELGFEPQSEFEPEFGGEVGGLEPPMRGPEEVPTELPAEPEIAAVGV